MTTRVCAQHHDIRQKFAFVSSGAFSEIRDNIQRLIRTIKIFEYAPLPSMQMASNSLLQRDLGGERNAPDKVHFVLPAPALQPQADRGPGLAGDAVVHAAQAAARGRLAADGEEAVADGDPAAGGGRLAGDEARD